VDQALGPTSDERTADFAFFLFSTSSEMKRNCKIQVKRQGYMIGHEKRITHISTPTVNFIG
jgi:hypothetical protein